MNYLGQSTKEYRGNQHKLFRLLHSEPEQAEFVQSVRETFEAEPCPYLLLMHSFYHKEYDKTSRFYPVFPRGSLKEQRDMFDSKEIQRQQRGFYRVTVAQFLQWMQNLRYALTRSQDRLKASYHGAESIDKFMLHNAGKLLFDLERYGAETGIHSYLTPKHQKLLHSKTSAEWAKLYSASKPQVPRPRHLEIDQLAESDIAEEVLQAVCENNLKDPEQLRTLFKIKVCKQMQAKAIQQSGYNEGACSIGDTLRDAEIYALMHFNSFLESEQYKQILEAIENNQHTQSNIDSEEE